MTTLVVALIALIIAGLSAVGAIKDEWNVGGIIALFIAVWLVSMFMAYLLFLSPMAIWKEQQDKLQKYEAINLAIHYDDTDPSCKRETVRDGKLVTCKWRVRITASQGQMVKNIVVKLEETNPTLCECDLPAILHLMSASERVDSTGWEGDGSFTLRPGEGEYVDVLRYREAAEKQNRPETIQFLFHYLLGRPSQFDMCSYKMTISASGDKGQAAREELIFEVNRNGLMRFYMI